MGLLSSLFRRSGPDNAIDALLDEASSSVERRGDFYRAFLDGTLYVPGEIGEGELMVRPYEIEGRAVILAFSSRERVVDALRDRPATVEVSGRVLCEVARSFDGMILNYRTARQKEFTLSEIAAMLDGSIFEDAPAGCDVPRRMVLGQPKEYPVRLMNDLQRGLPTRPEVHAAYLAQMYEEGMEGEPRIVIAFETEMGEEAFEGFLERVRSLAANAGAPDVLFLRLANDGLGEYLRVETTPFYRAGE